MVPRGKPSAAPNENGYLTALWIDKIREFRYKKGLKLPFIGSCFADLDNDV